MGKGPRGYGGRSEEWNGTSYREQISLLFYDCFQAATVHMRIPLVALVFLCSLDCLFPAAEDSLTPSLKVE
jgi:hypothetical protein